MDILRKWWASASASASRKDLGLSQYRIEDMRRATNNFDDQNRLGEGGYSIVYRGKLPEGTIVAVKRMKAWTLNDKVLRDFESEVEVLSGLHHLNLVSLLGFCADDNGRIPERILIYEYMERGTLERYIFKHKEHNLEPLDWHRRLLVALDVARAMEYLHSLGKLRVTHRDLKPANILLDKNLRAKVADFGLVKVISEGHTSAETEHWRGTFGYMAPECARDGTRVSIEMDVYSFGIILEVLVTGKKPRVCIDGQMPRLAELFKDMTRSDEELVQTIDGTLKVTADSVSNEFQSICIVAKLALRCTAQEPKHRPLMGPIVQVLVQLVEKWKGLSRHELEAEGRDHVNQILEQRPMGADLLGRFLGETSEHSPIQNLDSTGHPQDATTQFATAWGDCDGLQHYVDPHVWESLQTVQSKETNPGLQEDGARTLSTFAAGDQDVKDNILNVPQLSDDPVMNQNHNSGLAEQATTVISNSATEEDRCRTVMWF